METGEKKSKITPERIERALATMAIVIEHYGDTYWPIFDALEKQLEKRSTRMSKLSQYSKARRRRKISRAESAAANDLKNPVVDRTMTTHLRSKQSQA